MPSKAVLPMSNGTLYASANSLTKPSQSDDDVPISAGGIPDLAPARGIAPDVERMLIERTVAQVFGVKDCDLRRATRGRAKVARARQVAMYLAHVACGMSLTEVGRVFARDRTTVAHACGVIEDGRDDPMFDRVMELLEQVVDALLSPRLGRGKQPEGWLVQ